MNPEQSGKNASLDPVALYSSSAGVRAVKSPVKIGILTLLRQKEMPFDEIVISSGKVKSTVSVHLKDLEDQGIVGSKEDPDDARKKIFYLRADLLGHASPYERLAEIPEEARPLSMTANNEPYEFYRLMFRNIRVELLAEGINIDPILHKAGISVGKKMYSSLYAKKTEMFLTNIGGFWEHHHLGKVQVESLDPISLRVTDCFECEDLPKVGRPACAFEGGILLSLFSEYFQEAPLVCETACYAMGNKYCRFVISRKEPEILRV